MEESKENIAPAQPLLDSSIRKYGALSPRKSGRRMRSKSIGPGALDEMAIPNREPSAKHADLKYRRKSNYIPATKPILSAQSEKAERQAARRKTLANRRVSFAPEATLHTWDVIEFMRDPTTSTVSPGTTNQGRRLNNESPSKDYNQTSQSQNLTLKKHQHQNETSACFDGDVCDDKALTNPGSPLMDSNNPDNFLSSDTSEISYGDEQEDETGDTSSDNDNDTTAMSLETDPSIAQLSTDGNSSTNSSGQLNAALRQAAEAAGTRGIEYDEHGDDMSVNETEADVIDVLNPWHERHYEPHALYPTSDDQENIDPSIQPKLMKLDAISENAKLHQDTAHDLSMDMTRAVGAVLQMRSSLQPGPPMANTQGTAIDIVLQETGIGIASSQKRPRLTKYTCSPGDQIASPRSKRRRSSMARSSFGDESMDLTTIIGGVESQLSPVQLPQFSNEQDRRSSGRFSEYADITMDVTRAMGCIKSAADAETTASNLHDDEELTMELTTAFGTLKRGDTTGNGEVQPCVPSIDNTSRKTSRPSEAEESRFCLDFTDTENGDHVGGPFADRYPAHGASVSSEPPLDTLSATTAFPDQSNTARLPDVADEAPKVTTPLKQDVNMFGSQSRVVSSAKGVTTLNTGMHQSAERLTQHSPSSHGVAQRPYGMNTKQEPLDDVDRHYNTRLLTESIRLLTTPKKDMTTVLRKSPRRLLSHEVPNAQPSPGIQTGPNVNYPSGNITSEDSSKKVSLQEFLDTAGIRFMDLTAANRRFTVVPTPSRTNSRIAPGDDNTDTGSDLESAIVAGSCIVPELEMFEHACRELRRYTSDGQKAVKRLELQTSRENPPLVQEYMFGTASVRSVMDTKMREAKTQARLCSKEMWYSWRNQLLDDLMKALQSIGEGLINDDERLKYIEGILSPTLPTLLRKSAQLEKEAGVLISINSALSDDDKEKLDVARRNLLSLEASALEQKRLVESLQQKNLELDRRIDDLSKDYRKCATAVTETRVIQSFTRDASQAEIDVLKKSIHMLRQASGWSIASASSARILVVNFISQLELVLQPDFFNEKFHRRNRQQTSTIDLKYVNSSAPSTVEQFFVDFLRGSLHTVPHCSTRVVDLLDFISHGWKTAMTVANDLRQLSIEAPTQVRIISNAKLLLESQILLKELGSKIRISFDLGVQVAEASEKRSEVVVSVKPNASIVYGTGIDAASMKAYLGDCLRSQNRDWGAAIRAFRQKLKARHFHR